MPATNYTPIQFYRSTTSGNQPSAANLSPGELALNIADTDMTMYFENASGVVKRFFNNPAELKYPTADGTSGQGVKTDGSKTLSFGSLASAAITNNTRQAVTSSATTTIDLASGQVIDLTMAANITTLSFTNVPASGTPVLVQIVVRNASSGTAYTIAWPNSVYWSGQYSATTISTVQTAPALASGANGVTTIALLTTDGGTKWRGWVEALIPGGGQFGLYSWGANSDGKLGQGNTTYANSRSSPVQVGALTNWARIADGNGNFKLAVKTDGTLWAWGRNISFGQLGLGDKNSRSSPTQVGTLTTWSDVTTGYRHTLALTTSGQLFSWGRNTEGQLGQNSTTYLSSPVQVGSGTNWAKISAGTDSSFAVTTSGTLFSWGQSQFGQLGQNSTAQLSSPVQIGALSTWAQISSTAYASAAIKTDGTLWTWGLNNFGQLGHNNRTNQSSPIQVGALATWQSVSAYKAMLAVTTSNTLFAWGENYEGTLGLNDKTYRSSPVQVGSLATWASASLNMQSLAITTSGALFVWGFNGYGMLGLNTTTKVSSPVQVGSLTNWTQVATGNDFSTALAGTTVNPG